MKLSLSLPNPSPKSPTAAKQPVAPIGRPTAYRPELCDEIVAAMATGLSAESAAAKIGVSVRSLYYWQQEHPEFLHATQEGRVKALLWWEERALGMAQGQSGSAAIVSLGLRNRSRAASGWCDTNKLEVSGPNGAPVQHQLPLNFDLRLLDDQELAQFEQLLLKVCPALVSKAEG